MGLYRSVGAVCVDASLCREAGVGCITFIDVYIKIKENCNKRPMWVLFCSVRHTSIGAVRVDAPLCREAGVGCITFIDVCITIKENCNKRPMWV